LKFSCNDRKGLLHGNFSLLNFNSYFFFFWRWISTLIVMCLFLRFRACLNWR
jgi:hypothetical protein